jgi:hypothetical protein
MTTRATIAILVLAIVTSRAMGAIRVTRDGEPAPSAQLCYYAVAGTANPFAQQFASGDVRCSATLPAGRWNVYAREADRFISARTVLSDTADAELRLEPAATIELPAAGGAYLTDTVSFFPGTGKILVPAERDVLPLLVEKKKIVGIGSIVHLRAGENIRVDAFTSRALVTWLSIAPADLEALRTARKRQPPNIVANKRIKPMNAIIGTVNIDKALQIFSGLPLGPATIDLGGVPWKSQQLRVMQENRVLKVDEPLRLSPASSALVDWYMTSDVASLADRLITDCQKTKPKDAMTFALTLLKCSGADRDQCATVKENEVSINQRSGRVLFDDLNPSKYTLEFRYRNLPPLRKAITVAKFDQAVDRFSIDYVTLFGRVTVGGKAPDGVMRIDFDWNGPRTAVTDADGEYFAAIEKPLAKDKVVRIRKCDGGLDAQYILDRDVGPNSRLDIDLPSNKVLVEAVDAKTGGPVSGARVRYGAFRSEEMSSTYYFRLAIENDAPAHTDQDGRYVVENISPDKTVHVCLEHDDYERTCPDTFKLTSNETKTLRVRMQPRSAYRGRVLASQDIAAGQIYWYGPDGEETEQVPVKDDGSFRFNRQHRPEEVLVVVSINLPLYVQRQPMLLAGDSLDIAMPAAPVRRFEVETSEQTSQTDAIVTIAIGDLVVPYPAFSQHLALHGSTLVLRNRGPLLIPDILETGPISVLLGPPPSSVTPSRNDLFRLPQYRGVPRRVVGGPLVVFNARGPAQAQSRPGVPVPRGSSASR